MEKEKEKINKTMVKKMKSVNWESKMLENVKKEVNFNKDEKEKEYIDVEVINIDGSTTKEHVKCERKKSKEFLDKREKIAHDEYKKAKEFKESHKNDFE